MTHISRSIGVAALLTGCLAMAGAPSPLVLAGDPSPSSSSDPLAGIEILLRGEPASDVVVPDADLRALVRGNTDFALDLYRQVADTAGNPVLGPLSISIAMAMNQVGARGTTAAEIAQAMHFGLPAERMDPAFDRLLRELDALPQPGVEASIVSQLFGQRAYPFEEAFLEAVSSRYGAPLAVVDYGQDPEAVRSLINRWVASQTADRIADLIPPGKLSDLTRLVLVNAMYLKADWAVPFNAAYTEDQTFRLGSGKRVRVPTMARPVSGPVGRGQGYRAIELPYAGERLAMLIVVPDDVSAFEGTLDAPGLDAIVADMRRDTVDLTMPTWTARTATDLAAPLQALGIHDAFDLSRADLSGISPEPGLHIDAAVHQAFIKVAEQGTEAAAATAIGDSGTQGPPPRFRVDRPFLWFIRDRVTGSVLFLGRVSDPRVIAE